MPRSNDALCFYCRKQFRASQPAPKAVMNICSKVGPPTDTEIMRYGREPTPDGEALHGALSNDSPKAHDTCYRWMSNVVTVVCGLRGGRSKGLDPTPLILPQRRDVPDVERKNAALAQEAASAMGGSFSSAGMELPTRRRCSAPTSTVEPSTSMDIEAVGTAEAEQPNPLEASTAPGAAGAATVAQEAAVQGGPPAATGRRKGRIKRNRRLNSYNNPKALLRIARQTAKERNEFRKKLTRKITQHEHVRLDLFLPGSACLPSSLGHPSLVAHAPSPSLLRRLLAYSTVPLPLSLVSLETGAIGPACPAANGVIGKRSSEGGFWGTLCHPFLFACAVHAW